MQPITEEEKQVNQDPPEDLPEVETPFIESESEIIGGPVINKPEFVMQLECGRKPTI